MHQSRTVFIALVVLLTLCFCASLYGQVQTARIIVKGVSPDLKATGRYNTISSGLPNVGKGQKVWLEALALYTTGEVRNSWIDTILTEDWTLTNPPGGFATIIHTDTVTYFVPDTTGQYKVDLSVTTSHGTATASIYVNSAYWVGVGTMVGTPDLSKGECASCHPVKEAIWKNTPHASIFSNGIDGKIVIPGRGPFYTSACFSCHTTGYDQSPTAVNNGFDDRATAYGWHLPDTLKAGNWDSMKVHYPEVAKLGNIQCENCHGPGSEHYSQHDKNQIAVSLSADVCGQCHGAMSHHVKNYEWNLSAHAISKGEPGAVEHMNSASCTQCHTAQGFITENLGHGVSGAPYADVQSVTCAACHDPHSGENPAQLRVSSIAEACTGCHKTRISSRGLHHSLQGPMLAGVTGTPFTLGQTGIGNWGGFQFPGYQYRNSSHSSIADKCAECHMATIEGADTALIPVPFKNYRNKLGGHTFRVAYDNDTPDDATDDILNPVGCKECHGNVSLEFVDLSQAKIKALLEELRVLLPHATTGDTTQPLTHTNASLTTIQKAAAYNYYFVLNDGSYGVHNYEYASALLRSSIEMVKLGAGAASIASIKDVPNDQGKQVQVVWDKFPAENYPDPVTNYLVLRQDSASAGLGKASTSTVSAASFREMLTKVAGGTPVVLNGSVWTKVGEYKAIKQPKYSLVVPTLFDSTIIAGQYLTTFEVVGYTAANVVYVSVPMSGYSVDNLAPAPPAAFALTASGGVANLTWDASDDNDFKYFAVYRGMTPNFNPNGARLATTTNTEFTDATVLSGRKYYYKLTAIDFSGNESDFSEEKSILVTSVDDGNGIPTQFALSQNHPNPFNPSTTVKYQIPEAAHVKISVFNTIGKLVKTLVDRDLNAGYYRVAWDGTDNSGSNVASGIYLYKMEAGKFTSIHKMVLMK